MVFLIYILGTNYIIYYTQSREQALRELRQLYLP